MVCGVQRPLPRLKWSAVKISPMFKLFCHNTPIIGPIVSVVSVIFQGSTCPDFWQVLINTCKLNTYFFIFFFWFFWMMTAILPLVPKNSPWGCFKALSQLSPRFQHVIAIWCHFACIVMSCHDCSQHVITDWSPTAKMFDKPSDQGPLCHCGSTWTAS